jgi:hypothetical protein
VKKKRFTGKTLADAKHKLAAWKAANPDAQVIKEYRPVETKTLRNPTSVLLEITYEEPQASAEIDTRLVGHRRTSKPVHL